MSQVDIKDLLEAGVHLGHQRKKWNPKMQPFIYEGEPGKNKSGTCIINLVKTAELLEKACAFFKESAVQRKNIIFVATKRHISDIIKEEALRCGAFYINRRWLGGLLTNFDTIRHRLNRLRELEGMKEAGTMTHMNKKELSVLNKELEKLEKNLGGIKNMRGKPDILFVIDQQNEEIAIKEAKETGLLVAALIDTNCNPESIDYPIPGNDDSIRSVSIITKCIADSILEGYEGQAPDHNNKQSSKGYSKRQNVNAKPPVRLVQEVTVSQGQEVVQ